MFAVLAFICFLLALFEVSLGDLTSAKLVVLGLLFIALAMIVGNWPLNMIITPGRRNRQ